MTTFLNLSFLCAVCFGDPNSLESRGMFYGVAVLLGIICFILVAIAGTAYQWNRRANNLR